MHVFPSLDVVQESSEFDRIDQEADEWRARQIANDIAKRKVLSHLVNCHFIHRIYL